MDNQVTQLTTELKFIKNGMFLSVLSLSPACLRPCLSCVWSAPSVFTEMQVLTFQHCPPPQLLPVCAKRRVRSTCW